jgi:hypothetical protein
MAARKARIHLDALGAELSQLRATTPSAGR